MSTVTSDIDIGLPVSAVYNQWTQFEDFPAFMSGVNTVEQLNDSALHWRVHVGGVEREFDAVITEQSPDERIAWRSTSGPDQAGVVTFHRLDEANTRVRLQLEWDPQGFVEKIGAALNIDEAQVSADLREFRRLIESNGFETGAWRGEISHGDPRNAPAGGIPSAPAHHRDGAYPGADEDGPVTGHPGIVPDEDAGGVVGPGMGAAGGRGGAARFLGGGPDAVPGD